MTSERRLSQRLINYWFSLKGTLSDIPEDKYIPSDDIADLWNNCFLLKQGVKNDPAGFRYSYVGKEITDNCVDAEPHVRRFLEHMLRLHDSAALYAEKALEKNAPVEEEGEFSDPEGEFNIIYRRCFLPLKDHETQSSSVLGGFRWKVEQAQDSH